MNDASPAYRAHLLRVDGLADLAALLSDLAVDRGGINIMAAKGVLRLIRIEQLPTAAANIIKQEALARGGDLATPWTAAAFEAPFVDVILIGSVTTLRSLVSKLYRQPAFDLPRIAASIQQVLVHTTPGYLPVAPQPKRQGVVVEETLDDLVGGRIPLQPGTNRAPGVPASALDWPWRERTLLVCPGFRPEREGLASGGAPGDDLLLVPHRLSREEWAALPPDRPLLLRHEGPAALRELWQGLWTALDRAASSGVALERLLLDPGLDREKEASVALQVTRRLTELTSFGRPLLWSFGPGLDSLAALTLAVERGAHGLHAPFDPRLPDWIATVDRLLRSTPEGKDE
ncbi:MAG TPA: hypothetical protein VK191_05565 [Symbiobacteriaceae bacterium]|nr:hypothetical protein [Symbiobacteriaceae bacterium]